VTAVAEIIGAFGVPHNPHFPTWVDAGHPLAAEIERLYGEVARRLHATAPEAIIVFTSDHYNTFFEQSLPIFSIGVAESACGASDYPSLPPRELTIDSTLARAIHHHLVHSDFDVGISQEFEFDHTVIAPMWFLARETDIAVVPVFISAFVRPIPSAQRCYALGRAIREAVNQYPEPTRVAVVASGSFSLEIGGPRISDDSHVGVPAPAWAARVVELLGRADFDAIVEEATDQRLDAAGNAGGELLDWIAMLATIEPVVPAFLAAQPQFGHAFAAWPVRSGTAP
jgi:protocatechuate 4,5-dioxygenase beta chain